MVTLECPNQHRWTNASTSSKRSDASVGTDQSCPVCGLTASNLHSSAQAEQPEQAANSVAAQGGLPDLPSTGEYRSLASTANLSPASTSPPTEQNSTSTARSSRRGRFTDVMFHARGGLGHVHVARDEKLHRRVALKEIHPDYAHDEEARKRFLNEAEITGQLEHPGIVPVYALEEDEQGQPYYAMRFIEGRTLAQAIADYFRSPAPLAFRELLQCFVAVCQTVAFAHSRGVIHRDLKPANIMLGEFGETLVLDWGLAKRFAAWQLTPQQDHNDGQKQALTGKVNDSCIALPTDLLTHDGQVMGTPSFMSPEQAAGAAGIGPASDVYSLGAVLYNLLTGQPPFHGLEPRRVLALLREGPPASPRSLNPAAPKPLEAICLKAMARTAAERYATPNELAREIQRWFADEPVSACRENLSARAARWTRRHRTAVRGGVLALTAISIVSITATLLVLSAKRVAETERDATKVALQREAAAKNEAQKTIDHYVDVVTDEEVFKDPRLEPLRNRLLADVLPYYKQFLEEHPHDAQTRFQLAEAVFRLSTINRRLGANFASRSAAEQAIEVYHKLADANPENAEFQTGLAGALNDLASLQVATGQSKEALGLYRQAIDLERRLLARFPATPTHRSDLAGKLTNFGTLQRELGNVPAARECVEEAIALRQQLLTIEPESTSLRHELAMTYQSLALLQSEIEERPAAIENYRLAVEMMEPLVAADPRHAQLHHDLAAVCVNRGALQAQSGDPEAAQASYRRAIAVGEALVKSNPTIKEYPLLIATGWHNLGVMLVQLGEHGEARAAYQRGLAIRKQMADQQPDMPVLCSHLADSFYQLGLLERRLGNPDEALANYAEAISLRRKLVELEPAMVDYRSSLAGTLASQGLLQRTTSQFDAALASYLEAHRLRQGLADDQPEVPSIQEDLAWSFSGLGNLYQEMKQPGEARKCYEQALPILDSLVAAHPDSTDFRSALATNHSNLAIARDQQGEPEPALTHFQRALVIRLELAGQHSPGPALRNDVATSYRNLATYHHRAKRLDDAIEAHRKAIEWRLPLVEELPEVVDYRSELGITYGELALSLGDNDQLDQAAAAFQQAVKHQQLAFEQAPQITKHRRSLDKHYVGLARAHRALDQLEQAAAASQARKALWPQDAQRLFDISAELARCAVLVGKEDQPLSADEMLQQQKYGDQAMETLRMAVVAGFGKDPKVLKELKDDDWFAVVRKREDYQQLLATLEKDASKP